MSMWMESICAATGEEEFENVAILVAIAVNEDGYREVLGAAEGMKRGQRPVGSASSSGCVAVAWTA